MGKKAADRKDDLVIAALITNPTVRAASAACGVSETQIYCRLRTPAFKERYDRTKREMLEQCTTYVQGTLSEALEKMREIMNDPDASQQVQLNAAESIVRTALKLSEITFVLGEIEDIKKALNPNG